MYQLKKIKKNFGAHNNAFTALDISEMVILEGTVTLITGASGAGKSTFLQLLAGLIKPSSGSIKWKDAVLTDMAQVDLDHWRSKHVGMIFQDFQLFNYMSIIDNILLPFTFYAHGESRRVLKQRAESFLDRMGVPKERKSIGELSRGEQQRVAIIRALIKHPDIILADEPTASLDDKNAESVIQLLVTEAAKTKATLIIVSHEQVATDSIGHFISMKNGRCI